MKTMWTAGKTFKSYASLAATLGVLLLRTVIMAVPLTGLTDLGVEPASLFPDATLPHPIDPSIKTEQLRACHSRLDVINDAFSGDPENTDWKAEFIERFITRKRPDGSKEILFKVQWMGGEKSWVKMDDLRMHDPFLVVRHGLRAKLVENPDGNGWNLT